MCFSASANFVGSGVLGALGIVTLTKVKHRRELLFASLPTLFAIHQFIQSAKGTSRAAERIRNSPQASGLGVPVLRGFL